MANYDIVIIGGAIVGASLAYYLRDEGFSGSIALVERDPAARPQPAELARALGLSPTWFARLFRRTYGCAPRAWLVRQRIGHAAERLQSAASIGAVASEFGYADLFLFSRQFRAVLGSSPRRWLADRR